MEIENLHTLSNATLDELTSVWELSARSSHNFLSEADFEYFKPLIRNQYLQAVNIFAVRNSEGKIAAFMGLSDDMVEMLFILPEEQGKGYGKALLNMATDEYGITKVDVNEDNEKAYKFYLHLGYKVIGRDATDPYGKPYPIIHLQLL